MKIIISLMLIASAQTFAETAQNQSKTNLDFDGSVVEMVNRNPKDLNSLTMVGLDNSGHRQTLFHKKEHFRPEIQETLKTMGETP